MRVVSDRELVESVKLPPEALIATIIAVLGGAVQPSHGSPKISHRRAEPKQPCRHRACLPTFDLEGPNCRVPHRRGRWSVSEVINIAYQGHVIVKDPHPVKLGQRQGANLGKGHQVVLARPRWCRDGHADCDVGTQLLQSALVLGIAFGSDDHMNWQLSLHLGGRAQKPNNSIEFALICGMRPVRVFRSDQRAVERQEKQDCNARVID